MTTSDFEFSNHGSICLLTPLSEAAHDWVAEHLPEDALKIHLSVAIEPRYVGAILDGIINEGLSIQ